MKKLYILIIFLMGCSYNSYTQNNYNIVTSAVPFLRISTDARASGMGSTGIATIPDVDAVYWNAAKLPFAEKKAAINANYSPWMKGWGSDMFISSVAGYYKINDQEALHGLINYFNPGDLQFTDNNGNHIQSYNPNEFGVEIGYSRKLSARFGTGIAIKYLRSDLAKGMQNGESFNVGNAVAMDLGFYYNLQKSNTQSWAFGAALSNLGSKISYSNNVEEKAFIPANLGLGVSYSNSFNDENRLTIAVDVNKLLVPTMPDPGDSVALITYKNKSVAGSWFSSFSDAPGGFNEELKEFQASIGAEYWYNNQFALRAGYFLENKTKGDRSHFSAGAGIKYYVFTVNFAYLASKSTMNKNPLSNTLLFGLTINLK